MTIFTPFLRSRRNGPASDCLVVEPDPAGCPGRPWPSCRRRRRATAPKARQGRPALGPVSEVSPRSRRGGRGGRKLNVKVLHVFVDAKIIRRGQEKGDLSLRWYFFCCPRPGATPAASSMRLWSVAERHSTRKTKKADVRVVRGAGPASRRFDSQTCRFSLRISL